MSNQEDITTLNKMATHIKSKATWKDLSSMPYAEVKKLQDIADHVRRIIHRDHKVAPGKGPFGTIALFSGPRGTGKAMAAEVLAKDLKLDLYRVDLSTVVNKYIGETEKNLNHIFKAAEKSNAILFFDEADALFGKRSEVKDSNGGYANIDALYLLQQMENYAGLVILSTDMKQNMDKAFTRRLKFSVKFALSSQKKNES